MFRLLTSKNYSPVTKTDINVHHRKYRTFVHPEKGMLHGPYYRLEGQNGRPNNSAAIVESQKLLEGKGIGGRMDGVYAFQDRTKDELKDAEKRKNETLVVFFAATKGHETRVWGEAAAFWGVEELPIYVAAVIGDGETVVHDAALLAEMTEDAKLD